MDTNYKICCFTGHQPVGFPWDYYDKNCAEHQEYLTAMRDIVLKLINEQGYNYFISGGDVGADQDFAELILELRASDFPTIKLEMAVPFPAHDKKWTDVEKSRYKNIIDNADFVNILSRHYSPFCLGKRKKYMVNKSSRLICAWNVEHKGGTLKTIRYAERKKVELECIELDEMTAEAKEFNAFMKKMLTYQYEHDPEWRARADELAKKAEEYRKNKNQ